MRTASSSRGSGPGPRSGLIARGPIDRLLEFHGNGIFAAEADEPRIARAGVGGDVIRRAQLRRKVVAAIVHSLAQIVPGVGIAVPMIGPPLAAAAVGLVLNVHMRRFT